MHDKAVATRGFDEGERFGGRFGVAGVIDRHPGTGAGEFDGDTTADAAGGTGDESGFRDHVPASETKDPGVASQHTDY